MRNVVGLGNQVERFACHLHLLKGCGAVNDAEICGIGIVYRTVGRVDERQRGVGERFALYHKPVHGSTVHADAEVFLFVGTDDAFGNHDGSNVGFVSERQGAAGVGKTENRNRNRELGRGNAFSEADGAVSPPLRDISLVVEVFEKLYDRLFASDAEFDLDFFERGRHSVLAYVLGDDVENPLLFVGKHGKTC